MVHAKKSFGQHFLKSPRVVSAIIESAEIKKGETVVEVGPGTGVLTRALVTAGARVIAIEADRDLIPVLEAEFGDAIELIEGDALHFDFTLHPLLSTTYPLPPTPYTLCSNLPYNVGTEILERFLTSTHPPRRCVVMVQKEVGDRMMALPGDMSLLSLAVQIYADVQRVVRVPPGAFSPPPKVDSVVIRLDKNQKATDPESVIALAKTGFHARRKQLHRNLADAGIAKSETVKEWLVSQGLKETARAQELSVENWIALYTCLNF